MRLCAASRDKQNYPSPMGHCAAQNTALFQAKPLFEEKKIMPGRI
jgi:hypothetical protein